MTKAKATKPKADKPKTQTSEPKKIGRPKTEIDLELAEKLGSIQCTLAECSAILDVPVSTLSTHKEFSEALKRGQQKGKMSLRRLQFKHAETNPTMCIWLGKQYLGQTDSPQVDEEDGFTLIDNWGKNESKSIKA